MERIDTTRTEGDPLEDVLEKGKETPGQEEAAPVEQIPPVRYYKLFSTADGLDTFLMVIGAIGAMGNGALLPLFAIVFGEFTDAFGDPTNVDFMKVVSDIALKFLYLAIAAAVASYLEAGVWMFTGNRQTNRLRLKFLRAVLHQDVAFFDVQSTTGGLVQGLNEDSIDVQNAISEKLGAFLHHVCTFLVGFIIGFTKGWEMTLVMFGCMPFLALMGGWMAKSVEMANNATSKAYAEASAIAQQSISQIRTVAAYNREEESMRLYAKALDAPSRMIVTQSWVKGFGLGAIQFTMYGTYAAGLFFGAYRVAAGAYTGGQVLQVLMATLMGGFSLGQAAPNLQYFAKGCAAGGRMFRVIDRKPDISDVADLDAPEQQHTATHAKAANGNAAAAAAAAGKEVQLHTVEHKAALGDGGKIPAGRKHKQPDPLQPQVPSGPVLGEIQLQHVDFAYPSRPEILIFRDFSLHVPAGNTVALVGSSGSGKSTVVQLIERFYDPQAGAVLLDGRDLRTLPLRWLRSQVGLVSQEPTLFATTIYENIAIGLPGCSGEEVEAAARAANAHGFVSNLPLGYQTQVGERGVQLSGGQKQRIAIARAILKSPKVMLLDEATSALDTRSEALVQAALDRLVVGRTTVVVAHRLSTVQGADAIAVVQSGAVAQLGTHKELLRDETGPYAVLVKLQMEAQAKQQQAEEPEAVLEEGVEEGVPEEHVYDKHVSGALVLPAPDSGLAPAQLGGDGATHGKATLVTSYDGKGSGVAHQTSGSLAITLPHSVPAVDGVSGANAPKSGSVHGAQPAPRSGEKGAPASAAGADGAEQGKGQGDKDGKEAKEEPYQVPFKRLLSYAEGEGLACVIGCFASACAGAQHPAFAFVISSMIAIFYTLTPSELKKEASFYSWMFFVIAMGALISLMAQSVAFGRVAQAVSGRIRVQLFGSILRQEVGWFDEAEHSSGKLTANLATDATYVRGAVGDVFGVAFQNLTTLVLGYFIALAFDWRMALLITGVFPFIMFSMLLYMRFAMGFSSTADKLYASANQQVTEAFSSIRVIHAYNLQGFVAGTYEKMLGQANRLLVRQSTTSGLSFSYSNFVMFAMYAVIVYFMGVEIDRGWADFGDSLKAFMAILLAAMGMAQASLAFPDLGNAKAAIQRVFPIIDRVPPIDSAGQGGAKPDPETVSGEIEFRGVRFVYPLRPSVVIFNNFNLTVHPGRVTALVGESGSGKSTVVQLIERFYDPQAGAVLLDGVDVRQYNLRHLRSLIGLVSQEPLLFNGTVADNIRIGKQDATQEELEAAAEAANARSFIEALPEKYNTKVGEGGIQLSGGQKQRVAIARAVVKDPKVMLLDEATSALDARSEAVVQKALDRIMLGRTSVVIAHRLSTIRNAHTIAVVYRGAILEQGTHEELMALPHGSYARLVAAQSRDQQQHGAKA